LLLLLLLLLLLSAFGSAILEPNLKKYKIILNH
jgi:hypothetical protein